MGFGYTGWRLAGWLEGWLEGWLGMALYHILRHPRSAHIAVLHWGLGTGVGWGCSGDGWGWVLGMIVGSLLGDF